MCDLKSGCERVQLDRTETRTEREWTARIAAEFKKIGMPPHMLGHVYLCDGGRVIHPSAQVHEAKDESDLCCHRGAIWNHARTGGEKHPHGDQSDVGAGAGPGGPCWDVWRELSEQQPYQFGICGPYALESPAAIGEKAPAVGPGLFHGKA